MTLAVDHELRVGKVLNLGTDGDFSARIADHDEVFKYLCAVLRDPASYTKEDIELLRAKISTFTTLTGQEKLLQDILSDLADAIGKI